MDFSFLLYDFWFQSSRRVYVKFAEKCVNFSAFCGNLWLIFGGGFELLYSRVVRKLAAIVEWPGLSGLSIQWCFCENANFNFCLAVCLRAGSPDLSTGDLKEHLEGWRKIPWFGCIEGF